MVTDHRFYNDALRNFEFDPVRRYPALAKRAPHIRDQLLILELIVECRQVQCHAPVEQPALDPGFIGGVTFWRIRPDRIEPASFEARGYLAIDQRIGVGLVIEPCEPGELLRSRAQPLLNLKTGPGKFGPRCAR